MRLTPDQISSAMRKLHEGFTELGFKTLEDPVHTTFDGLLGVYLVAEDAKKSTSQNPLLDNLWFRVSVGENPYLGQYVSADFRAGPNFWLSVPHVIESSKCVE